LSIVSWILDGAFTFLMWTLLDPTGRIFFWVLEAFILAGSSWGCYYLWKKDSKD